MFAAGVSSALFLEGIAMAASESWESFETAINGVATLSYRIPVRPGILLSPSPRATVSLAPDESALVAGAAFATGPLDPAVASSMVRIGASRWSALRTGSSIQEFAGKRDEREKRMREESERTGARRSFVSDPARITSIAGIEWLCVDARPRDKPSSVAVLNCERPGGADYVLDVAVSFTRPVDSGGDAYKRARELLEKTASGIRFSIAR